MMFWFFLAPALHPPRFANLLLALPLAAPRLPSALALHSTPVRGLAGFRPLCVALDWLLRSAQWSPAQGLAGFRPLLELLDFLGGPLTSVWLTSFCSSPLKQLALPVGVYTPRTRLWKKWQDLALDGRRS